MSISKIIKQEGFTVTELLIVIVVIGVLAMVGFVGFNGMQVRAKAATLISDLRNASNQLKIDFANTNAYPATIAAANGGAGLKASRGVTYRYTVNNTSPQSFCLAATEGSLMYSVNNTTATPSEGSCVNVALGANAPSAIITDGNTVSTSFYNPGSGLQSSTVTLSSAQEISSVKVWHYYLDGRTYNATKTEVSEDGVTWVKVFDSATSGTYPETSAGKTHSFDLRKVRYIRDWVNGSSSNNMNHWVEIQAF